MIAETHEAAVVNFFAAHPDIAPHIGGPLDFTDAMRETAVYLFGEFGGFIYEWCAPRTYEGHVMLLPQGRGKWGFEALKLSVELMAAKGAEHLWCRVKPEDRHIAMFARHGGFVDAGRMTLHRPEPATYRILSWRKPCRHLP